MNFRHIGADFKIVVRTYFRNPVALFFSLIFPIILISLFGLIFANAGSTTVSIVVLNEDHNSVVSQQFLSALNNTSVVSLSFVAPASVSESSFGGWLGQNNDPVGLIIPAGFGANFTHRVPVNVTLFTNPQDAAVGGVAIGAVRGRSRP